ncbi:MAG: serine/threonine protein kinase, partial [Planctomycetes bacterium]|nr:serine/threonine protein kinase [Planctomycetota bacterium]
MDIKTDLLVRVALKHGLVSEETIAEVMREQAENKAKGLPSLKLGDALLAKGLIDLEKAKKFLREKSDTSTQVQFEELDASLQAGEKDCLADFESFDDLGSEEFSHELPAAQAPVAPAVGGAAKAGFEPEAETELEEEEELLVEDDEPPAPAPQPPQPGPQPEKTLLMPRSPKPEAGKPAAGEPEKTLIMPRSPKPAASQPVAGQPEKTLVMPRPAKPQPTTERPVALPTVTAPVPPAAPAKAAPAPNAGSQYDSSQTIAVPSSELKPGALDYQSTVNSDPMVGKMFGEYRIIQRLGADVAGVTYRAVFLRECRVVTLRILKMTSMANNPAAVEKFIATVRRAYKLEHPKIQRILTAGQNGKQLYYAAEYFTGNSLRRELMQKHTLSAQETINVALSVADALAYAHSAGMYHTQIDPSKIIIGTDGNVKLLGFGLGIEAADNLDWLAESLGDMPYYVAPEMATSGEARKFIGAVTDLYSLGAVMFHCLTGTPPFHGETLDEILLDMYQEENLHERLYASDTVPPELAELVLQLLNPEPQKRIGSAQDLIKLLRKVSNELMAQQTLGANGASAFGVDLGPAG